MIDLLKGLPLRVRLLIAMVCAVLPFSLVLLFANLWVYQPLKDDLELVSEEIQQRFEEISGLQLLLVRSAMPPNDYLIHGRDDERIRFEVLAARIESVMAALHNKTADGHVEERDRLDDMRNRWDEVRRQGIALLNWPAQTRLTEGAVAMERFDRRVDGLVEDAELLLAHVRGELEEARSRAMRRRHDLNRFVALSTVLAGILTVLMVTYLARMLMRPMGAGRSLQKPPEPTIGVPRDALDRRSSALEAAINPVSPADPGPAVDPLTHMWSRRSLHSQLAIETERALVLQTPSSLMILEIDHFAEVRDRNGASAGDAILIAVAERIRHVVRHTDFPARSGDAEFVVLMPATELASAEDIAERIREHIADKAVSADGHAVPVTASIGIAGDVSARGGHAGASTLLGRADQALHRARRAGGNRVERAGASRT